MCVYYFVYYIDKTIISCQNFSNSFVFAKQLIRFYRLLEGNNMNDIFHKKF